MAVFLLLKTLWLVLVILISGSLTGKWVRAQVHHVVGDDRGWDPSTDVASWSSGRTFRVGDKIWFTYSAAHGKVAELRTKEEYESCNVSNPIKLYSDGLFNVLLDGEGMRYFVSSNSQSCEDGLKFPVKVMPQQAPDAPKVITSESEALAIAAGPTPSSSANLGASFVVFFVAGFWLSYVFV